MFQHKHQHNSRVRAFPTHMSHRSYVEFHYATQFDIMCLSRGQGEFMGPLHRGKMFDFRTDAFVVFTLRHKGETTVGLFVSGIDNQTATTKVYPASELSSGKRHSRRQAGAFDEIERREGSPFIRPIARRVMRQRGTPSKMNAIAFWYEPFDVPFVKKFDQEKVEFSSENITREFV